MTDREILEAILEASPDSHCVDLGDCNKCPIDLSCTIVMDQTNDWYQIVCRRKQLAAEKLDELNFFDALENSLKEPSETQTDSINP